jgi:hypothetical protein
LHVLRDRIRTQKNAVISCRGGVVGIIYLLADRCYCRLFDYQDKLFFSALQNKTLLKSLFIILVVEDHHNKLAEVLPLK